MQNKFYKADVYSFSLIAYELLTNEKPFKDYESLNSRLKSAIRQCKRPDPSKIENANVRKFITDCWRDKIDERLSMNKIIGEIKKPYFRNAFHANKQEVDEFLAFYKSEDESIHIRICNMNYKLFPSTKTASVSESIDASGHVVIPRIIEFQNDKYVVTKIEDMAFANSMIDSLSFDEDSFVEKIGNYAFDNSNISFLSIPKRLTELPEFWCSGTKKLASIEVDPMHSFLLNSGGILLQTDKNWSNNNYLQLFHFDLFGSIL